jgi:predicted PurR-regulated permease PerM
LKMSRDRAMRFAVVVVGILIIAGIIVVSKAFYRGMLNGIALACFAMIILYWVTRRVKKD